VTIMALPTGPIPADAIKRFGERLGDRELLERCTVQGDTMTTRFRRFIPLPRDERPFCHTADMPPEPLEVRLTLGNRSVLFSAESVELRNLPRAVIMRALEERLAQLFEQAMYGGTGAQRGT